MVQRVLAGVFALMLFFGALLAGGFVSLIMLLTGMALALWAVRPKRPKAGD